MKVLIAESKDFCLDALTLLQTHTDVIAADLDRVGLLSIVSDFDVLWVRLRNQIDTEIMNAASRLKFIVTNTTGLNHIDIKEAKKRGITVISLKGETEFLRDIRATAEHTLGLILALVRRIPYAHAHVIKGGWNRDLFKEHELYCKTAGIIGYGRLGRIVSRYLVALGMNVLTADPNVEPSEVDDGILLVDLDELLQKADIVSLHVNLCNETEGFFGKHEFSRMKYGAWFINTARGELIDEDSLLWSLSSGRLAGAALDVLGGEDTSGMGHNPLVRYAHEHDNLILTPHIGGCTVESTEKTELFLAKKLVKHLECLKNCNYKGKKTML